MRLILFQIIPIVEKRKKYPEEALLHSSLVRMEPLSRDQVMISWPNLILVANATSSLTWSWTPY